MGMLLVSELMPPKAGQKWPSRGSFLADANPVPGSNMAVTQRILAYLAIRHIGPRYPKRTGTPHTSLAVSEALVRSSVNVKARTLPLATMAQPSRQFFP